MVKGLGSTILLVGAELDHNLTCTGVDLMHEFDLALALAEIQLIDTYSIGPHMYNFVGRSETLESNVQTLCELNGIGQLDVAILRWVSPHV
jgi:hypothetical protein